MKQVKDSELKITAKNCRSITGYVRWVVWFFDFIVTHQIIGIVTKRILHTPFLGTIACSCNKVYDFERNFCGFVRSTKIPRVENNEENTMHIQPVCLN